MSHDFDYESAERSALIERCRAFEALHGAEHALCMSTFKERDTYRELCGDLLEALRSAKKTAEFENHPFRGWHKQADDAIAKAEQLLGENNAT